MTQRCAYVALVLVAVLLWLGGCASNHIPTAYDLLPAPASSRVGFTPNWATTLEIPHAHKLASVTQVGDLLIAVERPTNLVTAVRVDNGQVIWRRIIGDPIEPLFPPVGDAKAIYINSSTRIFQLNPANGKVQYFADLQHTVSSSPALSGKLAIFGGVNGRIFAHDTATGSALWDYQITGPLKTPPVIVGNRVFVADANGTYALINIVDGRLVWRGRTFGPVVAPPAVNSQAIYLPCADQNLYALNQATGNDAWVFNSAHALTEAPAVFDELLMLPIPGKELVAIDIFDGTVKWRVDTTAQPLMAVGDHQVLLVNHNKLQLLDTQSGKIVADAPTQRLQSVLPGPDGSIFLIAADGKILRLNPTK